MYHKSVFQGKLQISGGMLDFSSHVVYLDHPFTIDYKLSFIFVCNAHISKSNQFFPPAFLWSVTLKYVTIPNKRSGAIKVSLWRICFFFNFLYKFSWSFNSFFHLVLSVKIADMARTGHQAICCYLYKSLGMQCCVISAIKAQMQTASFHFKVSLYT